MYKPVPDAVRLPNFAAHNLFRELRVMDCYSDGDDAVWRFEGGILLRFIHQVAAFEVSFVGLFTPEAVPGG